MAGKDTEEAQASARRRRVRILKKLIVIVPLAVIVILFMICIFLGVRLHRVEKELRSLQAEMEKTTVIQQAEATTGDSDSTDSREEPATDPVPESSTAKEEESEEMSAEAETPEEKEDVREVYLTFDDGPSDNTARILDILKEYDVKATFFVVGREGEKYQPLYKRIVEEGHTLGMHSYSHKYDEIYQSVDTYAEDLNKLRGFLYRTTGVLCKFCRFPGGSSNTVSSVDMHDLITYLDEKEIAYFDWNVSSGDAASSYISPEDIVKNCTEKLENYQEAIILMHDAKNKNSTVEALPELIETIQAMDKTRIVPITEETEPIHHISND